MATTIATVASLEGQAWAKAPDGTLRPLKVGDTVTPEEVIITAKDGRISLDFGDGHPVVIAGGQEIAMSPDLWTDLASDPKDAAVQDASVQEALTILNNGGDLTDNLEATAAGLAGGGADEGHSFVQLTRVVETTTGESFNFGVNNAAPDISIVETTATNSPAEITAGFGDVKEDVTTTTGGKLQITDRDANEDLFLVGTSTGNYGTFTIDANGNWTYTLNNDDPAVQGLAEGAKLPNEVFTVTSIDGTTQTVTVSITGTNDVASIIPEPAMPTNPGEQQTRRDEGSVTEDTKLTADGRLLVSDKDIGEDHFQAQTDVAGAHGTFSIDADGNWTYTLNNDDPAVQALRNGETLPNEVFKVWSADGSASHDVTITINGTSYGPEASADNFNVLEDTPLTIPAAQLLANDTDKDGDALSITSVQGATHGTVALVNGSVVFTPDANYNGPASFTYTITDGYGGKSTATVSLNVSPVNNPPASENQSLTTEEDTPVTGHVVATDVDGDALSYVVSKNPTHGTVTVDPVTGDFKYTPNKDYNGPDSFVVTVSDGKSPNPVASTSTSVIDINVTPVNDPAIITPADGSTDRGAVKEDVVVSTGGKLNVTDVDTGEAVFQVQTNVPGAHGSFSIDVNGNWNYELNNADPAVQALGEGDTLPNETFTVKSADGTTHTVTVSITGTNDAAIITSADGAGDRGLVKEDVTVTTGGKLNVADVDAGEAVFQTQTNIVGAHGTFSIDANGNWSYQLNNADPVVQGLKEGQALAPEVFKVFSLDGSANHDVVVTITGTNDSPVAVADSGFSTPEDTQLTLLPNQLLVNDTDLDGDTLSIASVQGATHGTVALVNGNVVFTPDANYNGAASFTYTVTDGHGGSSTASVSFTVTSGNDAPVAVNDNATTAEDMALTLTTAQLIANDFDADGDALTITSVQNAVNGTVTLNANGDVVFTPNANYNGPASFTYTVTDTHGATSTATVDVSVTSVNDAPVAVNDNATTAEDTALTLTTAQLIANDFDIDGDALTITSVQNAVNGTVTLNANGDVVFTPNANYNGPASFTYTVSDGHGGTSTATVDVAVTPVNDPAIITPDGGAGDRGVVKEDVTVTTGGKLNVADVDTGEAVFQTQTNIVGAHGTFSIDANGNWSYQLNNADPVVQGLKEGQALAPEVFKVFSLDGTASHDVVVTITGTNDAPVAVADSGFSTPEDTQLTLLPNQLLVNDTDLDGDTLSIASVQGATHGAVALVNGNVVFTPDANYNGAASFTYTVTDGHGGSSTASVSFTVTSVNDAPVAVNDNATTAEDMALTLTTAQLIANDFDMDGDALTITSVQNAVNGTVTLNANGDVVFTPNANYNGPASFTYTVSDGHGGTSTATVDVAVTPVNDPAIITPDGGAGDRGAVKEDVTVTTGGKLNVADVDTGEAVFQTQTNIVGAHGTFSIDANGNWSYQLNNADPVVQGLKEGQTLAPEVFKVFSLDGSANHDVVVTITGTNDGPVAVADSGFSTPEDTQLTLLPNQLLVNDTDLDGDTLSIASVQGATHGTVALVNGNVVFTPDANYNGAASFTYTVTDGHGGSSTASVSFTVTSVNDAPVAVNDNATTAEDTALTLTTAQLIANDFDMDGDALTITSVQNAVNGTVVLNANGNVVFTPNANYNGPASFTYTVNDGHGATSTATVNISVTPVNDAPVAVNDNSTTPQNTALTIAASQLLANDSDVDGDTLSIVSVQGATHGTVALDGHGNVIFTPATNYNGPASFTYTVTDGHGGTSTATVAVDVTHVNTAPVAVNDPGETTITNVGLHGEYYSYFEGPNGENLSNLDQAKTFIANHGPDAVFVATKFDYGTATLFNNNLGTGTNLQKFLGADAATLSNDPADSSDAIIRMYGNVQLAAGTYNFRVYGDDGYQIKIDGKVVAEVNENQAPNTTVHSSFTIPTSGIHAIEILYWDQGGQAVFKVEISNDGGATYSILSSETTTHIAAHVMNEDSTWTATSAELLANDSDADGDTLSIISVQNAVNGTVVLNANGTVTFTPTANYSGAASYTYTVSDGHGGTDTATVSIDVLSVNDRPQANSDILIAAKNTAAQGSNQFAITIPQSDLLVNDTDIDGNKLSITSVGSPVNGFVWMENGDVMFLPAVGFTGTAHFNYTISDNHGGSSTVTVDVMVATINGDANSNTINGTDSGETIAGLAGNDTIFGAGGNDFIDGGVGNDSIVGGSGNDLIKGGAGNDTLEGGSDNDTLIGGAGNDKLNGGTGNDLLEGGTGNDQLTGGAGADTFVWHLVDKGTTSSPATDTIADFTTGVGGDKLDIKDLLQNENSGNLTNYLHFASNGTDTTISISSSGDFDGTNYSSSTDQTIVLTGVNLTGTDNDIINQLKNNGNLITD